jgi:hypothetical protein
VDVPSDEQLSGLRRVVAYDLVYDDGSSPMRIAYSLRFEEAVLLIEADPEFDSLEVTVGPCPELRPQADQPPWRELLGRDLGFRWVLTNQNEYSDGLQLEFQTPTGTSTVVQWMTWASELQIVVFDWWRRA